MGGEIIRRTFPIVRREGDGPGRAAFTITTSRPDRVGDVVDPAGLDLTAYRTNPVVLFGHDNRSLPIGRTVALRPTATGIEADVEFASGITDFARRVEEMVAGGFLNAASIGFRPLDAKPIGSGGGVRFARAELLEWSIVTVPMNPAALARPALAPRSGAAAQRQARIRLAQLGAAPPRLPRPAPPGMHAAARARVAMLKEG